jgi:hypothetical protein
VGSSRRHELGDRRWEHERFVAESPLGLITVDGDGGAAESHELAEGCPDSSTSTAMTRWTIGS